MAERLTRHRLSHLTRSASTESSELQYDMTKPLKRKLKKPNKERWLLTRKTWRYMADAGRKLIPDNAQNRPEDIPKIEAYFQEVCKREPRFLLWRKNSYPGALGFRKKRKERPRKGGSCRKASSADEVDDIKPERPRDLALVSQTSGGRFDIQKMKYDFLNAQSPTDGSSPRSFLKNKETFPSELLDRSSTIREIDPEEVEEQNQLVSMLEQYLTICDAADEERAHPSTSSNKSRTDLNYQELVDKLQRHLTLATSKYIPLATTTNTTGGSSNPNYPTKHRETVHFAGDHVQKSLSETLSRYFSQSPNRDRVISDLLTNRKALEKLYFDLRKTKGFRGRRDYPSAKSVSLPWDPSVLNKHQSGRFERSLADFKKSAPPPLIEIQGESTEITHGEFAIQTYPVVEVELTRCEEEYKKQLAEQEEDSRDGRLGGHSRRRSSVDHDDVSQSVSDTIKRYLRMARKKSVDSDKADRFKRVNYDRNLRNIKAKGEITKPGDDDGLSKGCQTNDDWILTYRDLVFDEYCSESRLSSGRNSVDAAGTVLGYDEKTPAKSSVASSPSGGHHHHSFLSNLLHGKHSHDKSSTAGGGVAAALATSTPTTTTAAATATSGAMQKSKSSSSVMHHGSRLIAKKMFRSRSKSQTRPAQTPCSWTPQAQGTCIWSNVTGKQVVLNETTLIQLSEIERKVLQKVALAKLQALNLGVTVKVPTDTLGAPVTKPKRRPYLLKRKALTTSIFDSGRKDSDKESSSAGLVFGIPLSQCVENDRLSRGTAGRRDVSTAIPGTIPTSGAGDEIGVGMNRTASRASFSSLIDSPRSDEHGSCESLMSARGGHRMAGGSGSVPGLLDTLSCAGDSTADISAATLLECGEEPAVPGIVTTCIRYLEAVGLNTLGIFRVSTSKKRIRQLREDFDCGKDNFLENEQSPHDVATLLKEYLRDLPDPLLCRDLYQAFVQTQRIRNRKLQQEALQHLIQLLPSVNRDTLWTLLNFLAVVAKHSPDQRDTNGEILQGNKMDSNNLATVFAPNILHCIKANAKDTSVGDKPEDRLDIINVIRTLIDHNRGLFTVPAELLDEVYIHMMDSHPEALDQLLNKRDLTADESLDDLDSESQSNSAPWTPTALSADITIEHALQKLHDDGEEGNYGARGSVSSETRKTWSREEFLHESAATGGPNIGMRIRSKDRVRERNSKKRREESASRRKRDDDTSSSGSLTALSLISRLRGSSRDEDPYNNNNNNNNNNYPTTKTRSSSIESNSGQVPGIDNSREEITRLLLQRNQDQQLLEYGGPHRRLSASGNTAGTPYMLSDTRGIITASLTIPVQQQQQSALSVNPDVEDIPYIEDGGNCTYSYCLDGGGTTVKQQPQMTIGQMRNSPTTPIIPPRRRQRSLSQSLSDSTTTTTTAGGTTVTYVLGCYDSAMGSSAGSTMLVSSPPGGGHHTTTTTTTSSGGSSSVGDVGVYSSPPSWASTPPTSPDGLRAVNYIPDDGVGVGKHQKAPLLLQRVSMSATPEIQQIRAGKPADVMRSFKDSPSSRTVHNPKDLQHQPYTPTITSIGNAVLRSRTADFERIATTETLTKTKSTNVQAAGTTVSSTTTTSTEKKKYTKRRYTDSRHPTRHIPDSESLESTGDGQQVQQAKGTQSRASSTSSASSSAQVYKRKELISSVQGK